MSSSTGICALATNTVEDFLAPWIRRLHERTATGITKALVASYGLLTIGLAFGASSVDGPITQLAASVFGSLGSPVLGVFLTSTSVPWVNSAGAISGGVVSLVFNIWIAIGARMHGTRPQPLPNPPIDGCHGIPTNTSVVVNSSVLFNHTFDSNMTYVSPPANNSYDLLLSLVSTTYLGLSHNATPFPPSITSIGLAYNATSFPVTITSLGYAHNATSFPLTITSLSNNSTLAAAFGSERPMFLYSISYEWYSVLGTVISMVVCLLVSFVTRSRFSKKIPSYLLLPGLRKYWRGSLYYEEKDHFISDNMKESEMKHTSHSENGRKAKSAPNRCNSRQGCEEDKPLVY